MRNIKLTIEYDGSNYSGWQIQKNGVSIEGILTEAISNLVGHSIKLIGSSRTDAGVHAKGMVANFFVESSIPEENFAAAINSKLPRDIVVLEAEEVDLSFHSRYMSRGKLYSYTILNRKAPSALLRNYAAHVREALDIDSMKEACKFFIGTHDFAAFKSTGSSAKTSVRTVRMLKIESKDDLIKIFIEADGFLYNMVRIIVGTLIEVGKGKIRPDDVKGIIESKDRKSAGKTAPPQGLCLEKVYY